MKLKKFRRVVSTSQFNFFFLHYRAIHISELLGTKMFYNCISTGWTQQMDSLQWPIKKWRVFKTYFVEANIVMSVFLPLHVFTLFAGSPNSVQRPCWECPVWDTTHGHHANPRRASERCALPELWQYDDRNSLTQIMSPCFSRTFTVVPFSMEKNATN